MNFTDLMSKYQICTDLILIKSAPDYYNVYIRLH